MTFLERRNQGKNLVQSVRSSGTQTGMRKFVMDGTGQGRIESPAYPVDPSLGTTRGHCREGCSKKVLSSLLFLRCGSSKN